MNLTSFNKHLTFERQQIETWHVALSDFKRAVESPAAAGIFGQKRLALPNHLTQIKGVSQNVDKKFAVALGCNGFFLTCIWSIRNLRFYFQIRNWTRPDAILRHC